MRNRTGSLLAVLLLLSAGMAEAAERYSVQVTEQGKLYFFMPCKVKGNGGSRLLYDMTLLSSRDSVSVNMTLTAPQGRVRSVRLTAGEASYETTRYELYFQERKGSRFNTRIHIDCPIAEYRRLFASTEPLTLLLSMEDGREYAFAWKAGRWQKEAGYVAEVLEMIAYSNSMK